MSLLAIQTFVGLAWIAIGIFLVIGRNGFSRYFLLGGYLCAQWGILLILGVNNIWQPPFLVRGLASLMLPLWIGGMLVLQWSKQRDHVD